MISYRQAMGIVETTLGPLWRHPGTFYVDPGGWEDQADYLVPCGARESLVDGDSDFSVLDDVVTFVDKGSGEIRQESYMVIDVAEKVDAMKPVI